jgi:hypothetical protein
MTKLKMLMSGFSLLDDDDLNKIGLFTTVDLKKCLQILHASWLDSPFDDVYMSTVICPSSLTHSMLFLIAFIKRV